MSFVIAAFLASLVGAFEFTRHWILYSSAGDALGVEWNPGYLARGDFLRASATSGQSIVLGYVIAIAIGFMLALRSSVADRRFYFGGLLLLTAGVISPLSRGPWVGLAIVLFLFLLTGENAVQRIFKLSLAALPVVVLLLLTGYGEKVVDYLPFIGSVDNENVTYRKKLFDTSFQIILDNPFFGSTDYLLHMEELRQGQGIIDLVNTFLIVGLNTGFVGLGLYCLFFATICLAVMRRMKRIPKNEEMHKLGQALLATLLGALIIIATVSPIYHVPLLLWSVAAMALAYACSPQTTAAAVINSSRPLMGRSSNYSPTNVNSYNRP